MGLNKGNLVFPVHSVVFARISGITIIVRKFHWAQGAYSNGVEGSTVHLFVTL